MSMNLKDINNYKRLAMMVVGFDHDAVSSVSLSCNFLERNIGISSYQSDNRTTEWQIL
jgi:hypothetical protein